MKHYFYSEVLILWQTHACKSCHCLCGRCEEKKYKGKSGRCFYLTGLALKTAPPALALLRSHWHTQPCWCSTWEIGEPEQGINFCSSSQLWQSEMSSSITEAAPFREEKQHGGNCAAISYCNPPEMRGGRKHQWGCCCFFWHSQSSLQAVPMSTPAWKASCPWAHTQGAECLCAGLLTSSPEDGSTPYLSEVSRERVFLIPAEEPAASVLLQNHASNTSRLLQLTVRKSIYNDFAIVLLLMCHIWFSSAGFERSLWGRRR